MSHYSKTNRLPRIEPVNKLTLYYKLLSPVNHFIYEDICKAEVLDLSKGGARICSSLPTLRLVRMLGDETLLLGCCLQLDRNEIKILARLRWCRSNLDKGSNYLQMGIEFKKMSSNDQKIMNNFIVKSQIELDKNLRNGRA